MVVAAIVGDFTSSEDAVSDMVICRLQAGLCGRDKRGVKESPL